MAYQGTVANASSSQMNIQGGANPTGFNTVFVKSSSWDGTAFIEVTPDGGSSWFDVDGTNSQLTANGHVSFQIKGDGFRIRSTNTADISWWAF